MGAVLGRPGPAGRGVLAAEPDDRQVWPLFGISHAAAHRVIETVGPLLALAALRHRASLDVAIVDGTLIPTRDRSPAWGSKARSCPLNWQFVRQA